MPIYEYQCQQCDASFEMMRKMAQADESAPCPKCTSGKTRRLVSRVNAITGASGGEYQAASSSGGGGCGSCGSCNCGSCHH